MKRLLLTYLIFKVSWFYKQTKKCSRLWLLWASTARSWHKSHHWKDYNFIIKGEDSIHL